MEAAGEAGERVQAWLEEGRLRAVVDAREFKGVDSVADAVEYMLSGAASGKVVVRMSG
jgi:NADPH-dependent curcumin reductase CurA